MGDTLLVQLPRRMMSRRSPDLDLPDGLSGKGKGAASRGLTDPEYIIDVEHPSCQRLVETRPDDESLPLHIRLMLRDGAAEPLRPRTRRDHRRLPDSQRGLGTRRGGHPKSDDDHRRRSGDVEPPARTVAGRSDPGRPLCRGAGWTSRSPAGEEKALRGWLLGLDRPVLDP